MSSRIEQNKYLISKSKKKTTAPAWSTPVIPSLYTLGHDFRLLGRRGAAELRQWCTNTDAAGEIAEQTEYLFVTHVTPGHLW